MQEKCGVLWLKTDKNGGKYFSGIIGGKPVVIFKNKNKNSEKHPDYIVYPQQSKDSLPSRDDDNEVPF